MPNEQRLIELLTDYLIKADQSFERMDKMDERIAQQQEILAKQQEAILNQQAFAMKQSDRIETILQILIKHSESIEKIGERVTESRRWTSREVGRNMRCSPR